MSQLIFNFVSIFCALLLFCYFIGITLFTSGMIRVKSVNTILLQNMLSFSLIFTLHLLVGREMLVMHHPVINHALSWVSNLFNHDVAHFTRFQKTAPIFIQALLPCLGLSIIISIVAERIKLTPFLYFSLLYAIIILPFANYMILNWLIPYGYRDYSVSTLVYWVSAMAGLAGSVIVGMRKKRISHYPLEASNIPLSYQGMLFILLGSVGFNIGLHQQTASLYHVLLIAMNILLAFSAGVVTISMLSLLIHQATDISLVMNGAIASIVAVAALQISEHHAFVLCVGAAASASTFFMSIFLSRLQLEDPAGSFSMFAMGSAIGLASLAIEETTSIKQLFIQLAGLSALGISVFVLSTLCWFVIKAFTGLNYKNDSIDMDISECGYSAYPQFQIKMI